MSCLKWGWMHIWQFPWEPTWWSEVSQSNMDRKVSELTNLHVFNWPLKVSWWSIRYHMGSKFRGAQFLRFLRMNFQLQKLCSLKLWRHTVVEILNLLTINSINPTPTCMSPYSIVRCERICTIQQFQGITWRWSASPHLVVWRGDGLHNTQHKLQTPYHIQT